MNEIKKIDIKHIIKENVLIIISLVLYVSIKIINLIIDKLIFNSNRISADFYINLINFLFIILYLCFILCLLFSLLWLIRYYSKCTFEQKSPKPYITIIFMITLLVCLIFLFGYIYETVSIVTKPYINYINKYKEILKNDFSLSSFNESFMNFIKGPNSSNEIFILKNDNDFEIRSFDYYFYSLCVFFSTDLSRLVPNNDIIKILCIVEHIMAFFITITYIPMVISFMEQTKKKSVLKKYKDTKHNTVLKLEQNNLTLVYELIDVIEE